VNFFLKSLRGDFYREIYGIVVYNKFCPNFLLRPPWLTEVKFMAPLTSLKSPSGTLSSKTKPQKLSSQPVSRFLGKQGHKFSTKVVCDIVHEVPGRVRFRVPRLVYDADYAQSLQRSLEANPDIQGVRVNRAAGSIVINYDVQTIAPPQAKATGTENYSGFNRKTTNVLAATQWIDVICKAAGEESTLLEAPIAEVEKYDAEVEASSIPFATPPVIRACSLEVRQANVPAIACGLFQNRKREPLKGGSLVARLRKLQRFGILVQT
jgi:hypothetical protein